MKKELNFFGIETIVESDNLEFLVMLEQSLSFFTESDNKNVQFIQNKKLFVTFLSKRKISIHSIKTGFSKIGTGAFLKEKEYFYISGFLVVQMKDADGNLSVLAQYRLPDSFEDWLKVIVKNRIPRYQIDYFFLIRILVLFPIFMILEREKNFFLLHGSAVEYGGKGIVFAGLANIGKSVAALSLTLDKDAKFLSDNFLIFDENYVYPFPEYIRLSDNTLKLITNISKLGKSLLRRFKRNYYILNKQYVSPRTLPEILFIPRFSKDSYIKQITTETAIDRLLLANDHVKEFHNYHHCGLLNYGYYEHKAVYKNKIETLEKFLSNVSSYEIGICKSTKPAEFLAGIINDVS
jgi:hypothetical protein